MGDGPKDLDLLRDLPVSVNGLVGDSLQPSQWLDTLEKLNALRRSGHRGPVMIPTKRCVTQSQTEFLARHFPDTWVFVAVTGLNEEPKRILADYRRAYLDACRVLSNVVCVIRPIIPGHNDAFELLEPILTMAREGSRMLVIGGYVDGTVRRSTRVIDPHLSREIVQFCDEHEVVMRRRTACLVAAARGRSCVIHSCGKPKNLGLLRHFGYEFQEVGDTLVISESVTGRTITRGDLNFIRMLTGSQPRVEDETYDTELLSVGLEGGRTLACSSSWFTWARQVPCDLGCWYCFDDDATLRNLIGSEVGCNPDTLSGRCGSLGTHSLPALAKVTTGERPPRQTASGTDRLVPAPLPVVCPDDA